LVYVGGMRSRDREWLRFQAQIGQWFFIGGLVAIFGGGVFGFSSSAEEFSYSSDFDDLAVLLMVGGIVSAVAGALVSWRATSIAANRDLL